MLEVDVRLIGRLEGLRLILATWNLVRVFLRLVRRPAVLLALRCSQINTKSWMIK